jgi:hypothetical protein
MRNLALEPEKNRDTILRMNGLLNDLIAKEVGVNRRAFSCTTRCWITRAYRWRYLWQEIGQKSGPQDA